MNETQEELSKSEKIRVLIHVWLVYLGQVFLYASGVAVLVAASFLFTGKFSAINFSDRLFIVGIFITLFGVFIFITIGGTRRNMGLPTYAKTKEDARKIIDHADEIREKTEKRYDAGSKVWAVGTACMLLSILFFALLSIFKS